ncbi:sialate O-acetylesterase [Paraflavitalea speifideaquila]|uniref:sialate O-acetylesterase n=1 Tax=Paraflavitalea speifideaquila TaxID=3076558 RepID=UPI0028E1AB99|nr:sialate O-acetylesterase [Paraflavitalea speifideiaquila]
MRIIDSRSITITNPSIGKSKPKLVELIRTDEEDLSLEGTRRYPEWLHKADNVNTVTDTAFYIFLLAGQSNMAGRGKTDDSSKVVNANIFMLNSHNEWVPAVDPVHYDKPLPA